MKMNDMIAYLVIGTTTTFYFGNVVAGPADYIYTPNVEQGEKEIDFKFGTDKQQDGSHKTVGSMGFGYGVNENWFTEVYLKSEHQSGEGLTLAEWENKFQLTETGKYPIDIGLISEIEAPLNNGNEPWELKLGPLFQSEIGRVQMNGNLLFERKFGPNDTGIKYVTEIGYQWQVKYRWQPSIEWGAQGFGEMGQWDHWDNASSQNHRFGPAVFGKLALGNKQAIKYNAAYLLGVSDAAPNNTFRMQLEYEF